MDLAATLRGDLPYSNRQGRANLLLGLALRELQQSVAAEQAFAAAVLHLSNTVDADHPLLLQARQMHSTR